MNELQTSASQQGRILAPSVAIICKCSRKSGNSLRSGKPPYDQAAKHIGVQQTSKQVVRLDAGLGISVVL